MTEVTEDEALSVRVSIEMPSGRLHAARFAASPGTTMVVTIEDDGQPKLTITGPKPPSAAHRP